MKAHRQGAAKGGKALAIHGLFCVFALCLNYARTTHKDPLGTTQNRIGGARGS
jgi:hypothetical protein